MSEDSESLLGRAATAISETEGLLITAGAGTAVPTVRITSEGSLAHFGGTLIHINTREPRTSGNHVGLAMRGLEALQAIDERVN